MKNLLVSTALFFFLITSYSANPEKEIKSSVHSVTVYLNGAQVYRKGTINLKKGINSIFFNDVSPYLNAKTIQVEGKGDFVILESKKNVKRPEAYKLNQIPPKINAKLTKMQDSLEINVNEIRSISTQIGFLNLEKKYLLNNKVFSKDSLEILQNSLSYLRKQLFDINKQDQLLKNKLRKVNKKKISLQTRMVNLRKSINEKHKPNRSRKTTYQVEITVLAKKDLVGRIDLSYFVSQASWSPSYDIRVKDISNPVELTMKATVYQNTGEDWENTLLTLSTNNPYKNKVKPELSTWYINYYNPSLGYHRDKNKYEKKVNSAKVNALNYKKLDEVTSGVYSFSSPITIDDMPSALLSTKYTVKKETMANVEYKIDLKYSIKSNNQAHLVAINQYSIKANYIHYLVPKYDVESYLVAQLVDWEELNLLPSKANLFYDGSYIGETRINPTANDTLYISLGNDRNVRVKKIKDKEKSKEKIFSSKKSMTISYDILVKNLSSRTYHIIVEEQLPVSRHKTIEIELRNKSKAKFNEKNGMLKWDFKLKSKENKKINYLYKIEYDKEKRLDSYNL